MNNLVRPVLGPDTEAGLPVWRFEVGGVTLEKRVLLPHLQNTVRTPCGARSAASSAPSPTTFATA